VAKHPVTKPNLNVIRIHEKNLEDNIDNLVNTALETDEVIEIKW
jgi:thiamine biosynthesis protein ThiI